MKFEVIKDEEIKVLRAADGTVYIVGGNDDVLSEYNARNGSEGKKKGYAPVYNVVPILNEKRSYGIEVKPDKRFRIVTAEELVAALLK